MYLSREFYYYFKYLWKKVIDWVDFLCGYKKGKDGIAERTQSVSICLSLSLLSENTHADLFFLRLDALLRICRFFSRVNQK